MSTTATDGRPEPSRIVTASASGDGRRRAQRLGPLVHELLSWDLVRRTDSGDFELCEDVQQRLRAAARSHPSSRPSVFVGRPCEACGATGQLTRKIQSVRLCPACQAAETAPVPFPGPEATALPHPGLRGWRRRRAG